MKERNKRSDGGVGGCFSKTNWHTAQQRTSSLACPFKGGVVGGGGISAVRRVHIKGSKHDINNVPT